MFTEPVPYLRLRSEARGMRAVSTAGLAAVVRVLLAVVRNIRGNFPCVIP